MIFLQVSKGKAEEQRAEYLPQNHIRITFTQLSIPRLSLEDVILFEKDQVKMCIENKKKVRKNKPRGRHLHEIKEAETSLG